MSQNPHFDPRNLHCQSDADKNKQPRYPKPDTEARLANGQRTAAASQAAPKPASTLSASAPEFKPKASQNQGGSSSVVQVPVGPFTTPPPYLPPPGVAGDEHLFNSLSQMSLAGGDMATETDQLVAEFSRVLMILTTHPANIREFLAPLCDKLQQAHSPDILSQVIHILYEQSVYEPNFHYTGARVVHFLCQELKDHPVFKTFKAEFLKKCQLDYSRREELIKSDKDGLTTLCGLTLFMGELFHNVTADASGHTERLDFLPNALTDLLLTLLTEPTDTSIKTACLLLKMAGGPIEDSMSQKPAPDMQKFHTVFTCLQGLLTVPQVSQNMKCLIQSVQSLRQNNWGRGDSRSPNTKDSTLDNTPQGQPEFVQLEPVFYNQYGVPITRKEAGYLEDEDEDDYDAYELTEEEEADFLLWQEEDDLALAGQGLLESSGAQPPFPNGSAYQPWSTAEPDYSASYQYSDYPPTYEYSTYPPYIDDEGLSDEMEKAYEEFLSHQGDPGSK